MDARAVDLLAREGMYRSTRSRTFGARAISEPATRQRAPQREPVLQYGIDERLLLFSALGLEVGHVEVTADEAARLRLEALELKLLEAVADLRG